MDHERKHHPRETDERRKFVLLILFPSILQKLKMKVWKFALLFCIHKVSSGKRIMNVLVWINRDWILAQMVTQPKIKQKSRLS